MKPSVFLLVWCVAVHVALACQAQEPREAKVSNENQQEQAALQAEVEALKKERQARQDELTRLDRLVQNLQQASNQDSVQATRELTNAVKDGFSKVSRPKSIGLVEILAAVNTTIFSVTLICTAVTVIRVNHQWRLSTLLEFSKRYAEITTKLPQEVLEKNPHFTSADVSRKPGDALALQRALRELFVLYLTEYKHTKSWEGSPAPIGEELWNKWKLYLGAYLRVPVVKDAWQKFEKEWGTAEPGFFAEFRP